MLTPEQQELRRCGIGGSEIAAVAGLNPYEGPLQVWLRKKDLAEHVETDDTERGQFLESGMLRWYRKRHGDGCTIIQPGTLIYRKCPIVRATPDFQNIGVAVGEIKVPRRGEQWGEPGTDDIPDYHIPQLIWEMAVTGERLAHQWVLRYGSPALYEVPWDEDLFNALRECAEQFWHDHVKTNNPPPVDGSEKTRRWLDKQHPRAGKEWLNADSVLNGRLQRLHVIKRNIADLEREESLINNQLRDAIGPAHGLVSDVAKVTWGVQKGKIAYKRACEAAGLGKAQLEQHRGAPSRVLRVTFKREV